LRNLPTRVEAFDVAHISGKEFATATSVWDNGKFVSTEYGFRISDETSELRAMADAVASRLAKGRRKVPDIILIDGGRPQLNAVLNVMNETELSAVSFVGAVKPTKKHSSVSHFIYDTGDEIDYDPFNPAQNMLRLLRDDAHELANRVHRDLRDMRHNYELASVLPSITEAERREALKTFGSISKIVELSDIEIKKYFRPQTARKVIHDLKDYRMGRSQPVLPLIVPIRFDDPDVGAGDLRPIVTK
jgi:excinuclease ABC subunit C